MIGTIWKKRRLIVKIDLNGKFTFFNLSHHRKRKKGLHIMKIQEKDLFHGAALTQIIEHPSFKALNKADEYGYQLNHDRRLLVKYSKVDNDHWQFTFQQEELDSLRKDISSDHKTFLCLVCSKETICLLGESKFTKVLQLDNHLGQ